MEEPKDSIRLVGQGDPADRTLAAAVTKLPRFAFTGPRENLQAVG